MQLNMYTVSAESSIVDAMKKMNSNSIGMIYVVEGDIMIGVITDGDIRRYILSDGNLADNVLKIANVNPKRLFKGEEAKAKEIMDHYRIRSIPIVDTNKKIVNICFRDDYPISEKKILCIPVVIMAGGKGTRLYPYTQVLPKPLIPIGEKTITEHIMSRFQEYGCNHFDMIVNHKKNFIKSYFLDNENTFDVEFIDEEEFLGTGGGLKLLNNKYNKTFFMTNCDILIEEDYGEILEFHKKNNNIITMVCAEKNMVIPYGTVEVSEKGKAISLKEKPSLSFVVNTGLYVIEPEFLDMIPEGTFVHITDVIQKCIDSGMNVGVYKISEEKWLDMGQLEELEKMKQKLNVN